MISVIIPAYNEQRNLGDCVNSVRAQTNDVSQDVEIIVCNDASTDGTEEILENTLTNYKSVTAIHNSQNKGILETTQRLVDHAVGDVILRIDADSTLRPGSLAYIERSFERGTDVLYGKVHVANTEYLHPAACQLGKEQGSAAWYGAACVAIRSGRIADIGGVASMRQNIELELMNYAEAEDWTIERTGLVAIDSHFPTKATEWMPRKHTSGQVYIRESADRPQSFEWTQLRGPLFWTGVLASAPILPVVSVLLVGAVLAVYVTDATKVADISGAERHRVIYPLYMAVSGILRTVGVYRELPLLLQTVRGKYA